VFVLAISADWWLLRLLTCSLWVLCVVVF